jgi:hypothetical protein
MEFSDVKMQVQKAERMLKEVENILHETSDFECKELDDAFSGVLKQRISLERMLKEES